jgi:K+-transporting ATPase ATPase A chain
MTAFWEIASALVLLLALSPFLGAALGSLFDDGALPTWTKPLRPLERAILAWIGPGSQPEMDWRAYSRAILTFSGLGILCVLGIELTQSLLPFNPQNFPAVPIWLALNTAVSFVTNTNWQAYSGEATLSYFTQMVALTTQNFVSAGAGIAVMAALARGIRRTRKGELGNFWRDVTRATVYVLLPLSFLFAIAMVSQGVVQNLLPYIKAQTLSGVETLLPMGPAASQIAIKQLGTNGGGFFGGNSAHPFENPTPLINYLQCLAILLLPAALPFAFGRMVGNVRHGRALFVAMFILFLATLAPALWSEFQTNPALGGLPFLEGKETRIGIGPSVLWGISTTVASNGSVNAALSSFSPLAGGLALLNILFGEVVFGGVGSGVYGMVLFAVLTVFIAGLMVGRSPEYLGKKIEATEIRFAVVGVLLPSVLILLFTALACSVPAGLSSASHAGPHGLTEILYAFASGAGNNGSAFGGLNANTFFYNVLMSIAMLVGRFGVIVPVLLIANSLSAKKPTPASAGTFETHGALFSFLLCCVVVIVGALTFFPALCLGPIMEQLMMAQGRTF